jgi:hypothetical protein
VAAELVVDTTHDDASKCVERILSLVASRCRV